jgi:hypothetical protein
LAETYGASIGKGLDLLLLMWLNRHPYFRKLAARLEHGPLKIPRIGGPRELGLDAESRTNPDVLFDRLAKAFRARVELNSDASLLVLRTKFDSLIRRHDLKEMDPKRLADFLDDSVVCPAFLDAEGITFDTRTFEVLIRAGKEFLSCAATTAAPDFDGLVVFATAEFTPSASPVSEPVIAVKHRGVSFASPGFLTSLSNAYSRLSQGSQGYVDAYAVRAAVCLELGVQPKVFETCLSHAIQHQPSQGVQVFTELPFAPPPAGEDYLEIARSRIGRLKIITVS